MALKLYFDGMSKFVHADSHQLPMSLSRRRT
jgi:hypothetical protein